MRLSDGCKSTDRWLNTVIHVCLTCVVVVVETLPRQLFCPMLWVLFYLVKLL